MEVIHGKLGQEGNNYTVNHKKAFEPFGEIGDNDKSLCFGFAYEMAYGKGKHRVYRSGGDKKRKPGEIFINTYQGKLAEFATYRYLVSAGLPCTDPDLSVEGEGKWDSFDIECMSKHIAVKSTKFYGNLLLLETKDWAADGEYLPNRDKKTGHYDYFILVRLYPDGEQIMKNARLLYSEEVERKELEKCTIRVHWKYDIAGFLTEKDFINLIKAEYILPKGAVLNGSVPMDAENYYVQTLDMREPEVLIERLQTYSQLNYK